MSQAEQMLFDDDVVIVTGAGRGLGREHGLLFASRGARVVVNDIDLAVAREVVSEITSAGGEALAHDADVSTQAGAQALVKAACERFGDVTVLVNNAGVISFAPLENLDEAEWRTMQAVTLDGAFHMSQAVWPIMVRASRGRIVNTTSNAGFAGSALLVHHGAAKLGVAGLTQGVGAGGGRQGDHRKRDRPDGDHPHEPRRLLRRRAIWRGLESRYPRGRRTDGSAFGGLANRSVACAPLDPDQRRNLQHVVWEGRARGVRCWKWLFRSRPYSGKVARSHRRGQVALRLS